MQLLTITKAHKCPTMINTKTTTITTSMTSEISHKRRSRINNINTATHATFLTAICLLTLTLATYTCIEARSTEQLERDDSVASSAKEPANSKVAVETSKSEPKDDRYHHIIQELPERDRSAEAANTSAEESQSKIKCTCNGVSCIMSHQRTKVIEGGPRPSRQSPESGTKYALNSVEYRMADATNRFGLLFLNNLGPTKGNTIYSPVSLQAILNMVYLGAKPNSTTWRELSQGLGYEEFNLLGREEPHQGLYNIIKDISDLLLVPSESIAYTDESAAESVAGDKKQSNQSSLVPLAGNQLLNFTMTNLLLSNSKLVDINPDYKSTLNKYYKVKLAQFKRKEPASDGSPEKARSNVSLSDPGPVLLEVSNEKEFADAINLWVSENTNHNIKKLVEESDVPLDDLALALVNSAHFKAAWLDKFDESQTHEMYFYNEGREEDRKLTPFMRKTMDLGYAQFVPSTTKPSDGAKLDPGSESQQQATIEASDLDCQALEIPFSIGHGKELSMLLLLPRHKQGLDKLQRSLTWSTLRGIYSALEDEKVEVRIPKFTFEESYDVKKILERMGISSMFDPTKATLTEMLIPKFTSKNGTTFSVDKILHKAKIEVHESGAEASAATYAGVLLRATIYVNPIPKFIADHPFIFIIRHNKSNLPLFMGRVNQF